jgi:hypothetical protein
MEILIQDGFLKKPVFFFFFLKKEIITMIML